MGFLEQTLPFLGHLSALWKYGIPFLVLLTPLVFVHELGHYLIARRNGVRVEVFSIGFGPEIYGWTAKSGTRWKISAIPFGGYVKMFGENRDPANGQKLSPEDQAVAFHSKRLGQRAAIVFAGPAANFLFALVALAILFATVGQPFTPADVNEVVPGSAAERAGIKSGDVIVAIDGTKIERFEQIQRIVQLAPGRPLVFTIMRDGRQISLDTIPEPVEKVDRFGNTQRIGMLGISRPTGDMVVVRHDPFSAVWRATKETASLSANILDALWQIISGTRTAKELGGPLRIAQMSGDVWDLGFVSMVMFAVLLSINLGMLNLFPIPMLDGGHLLFYAVEGLLGRPMGERAQDYGFRVGLALVLSLMLFATWNDLVQLRVVEFLKNLVS
jgi:regulator of sigma E protease